MNKAEYVSKAIVVATLIVATTRLVGVTDATAATKTLLDEGYTNVTITGHRLFGCGELYRTGFTATGPTGRHVEGVVCRSWLKSATVRLD